MARVAWLARRAPSISLETRSLGTGIDAAGSLNINASLGAGNQGDGGGREAAAAGTAFLLAPRAGGHGSAVPSLGRVCGPGTAWSIQGAGKNKA